ncbi:MAG: HAD-IIIA family hydrolase [Crocinitomicaceae bacterium]|nr:HAD-IIIA family hydrolase [Crocinitomicaceae bacterium]
MNLWNIDSSWTLFLDRDGVINSRKIGGYIETIDEFEFLPNAKSAIVAFSHLFNHVFVVTNQQGIGKGIMTESNLLDIHRYMMDEVENDGGKITKCYHAPALANDNSPLRKPNTGMGLLAQSEFDGVDFQKSIMIGDSDSDIIFGTNLGMKTVRIVGDKLPAVEADLNVKSLYDFYKMIQ